MSIYVDVELALVQALSTAPGLTGVAITNEIRDCLFSGDKLTQGFRADELPTIRLTAQEKPSTATQWTTGEALHEIAITLVVVTRGGKKQEPRERAFALQTALVAALNKMRRSDNGLGANTVLAGDIASSPLLVIEEKPHFFALASTDITIRKVVEL